MDSRKMVIGGTWIVLAILFAVYYQEPLATLLFLAVGVAFIYSSTKSTPKETGAATKH
ncbi:hypothetical protein [Stomatohabitans albus]|uniref:hypothetical protein n=1 Tax=Stomatohabitans albus TaxID=3110766 RepID=UPI00300C7D4F